MSHILREEQRAQLPLRLLLCAALSAVGCGARTTPPSASDLAEGGSLAIVDVPGPADAAGTTTEVVAADVGPVTWPEPWSSVCQGTSPPWAVAPSTSCQLDFGAAPSPLELEVEWEVTDGGTVGSPIMVANLDDDDGDGAVTASDIPDLVVVQALDEPFPGFNYQTRARIVVYSGTGGEPRWSWPPAHADDDDYLPPSQTVAIGDIDGDALPDIVFVRGLDPPRLGALNHDGTLKWLRDESLSELSDSVSWHVDGPAPTLVRRQEGCATIVVGTIVLDCEGGPLAATPSGGAGFWEDLGATTWKLGAGTAVDVDLDSELELVASHGLFTMSGAPIWQWEDAVGSAVVLNADADPEAEVFVTRYDDVSAGPGSSALFDTNGDVLWQLSGQLSPIGGRPALVEDLDGDGSPEIVIARGTDLVALNHDGSMLWHQPDFDWSPAASPTAFDFERDGRPEVIAAGEHAIRIHDGPTGVIRWESTAHASKTAHEYPVIADVDRDGHAEIVVTRGWEQGREGFTVWGSAHDDWAPARPIWNQFLYMQTNIEDDGTIPSPAVPHFTANNSVRSAVQPPVDPANAWTPVMESDVEPELVVACAEHCAEGLLEVRVRLLNRGYQSLPAGVSVTLRRATGGLILTRQTSQMTPALTASADLVFTFKISDTGGEALVLVADDDGTIDECDESNNTLELPAPGCG